MSVNVQFANGSVHVCKLIAMRKGLAIVKFQDRVFSVPTRKLIRVT
jgi:hypothetical protein